MDKKSEPQSLPPVPLGIARSALFSVASEDHEFIRDKLIATSPVRGTSLRYTGPRLGQHHALLWQAIIQAAYVQGVSTKEDPTVETSCDALAKAIGCKGRDTRQRARIWRWLRDLMTASIEYSTDTHLTYARTLVYKVDRVERNLLSIKLDPELFHLLGNEVLHNNLARKASLGRCALTLWLHDYISTHLRPPVEQIEALRVLCGSPLALPQFRQRLAIAMDALKGGDDSLVASWEFVGHDRERIKIEKRPTKVVILPVKIGQTNAFPSSKRRKSDIERAQQQRSKVAL